MKRTIGLISDTHGYLDPSVLDHFAECDQIWHAGDFGTLEIADRLADSKPFLAVYGNIDDHSIQDAYPLDQRFDCCGVDVWITHIAGYPGRYDRRVNKQLKQNPPQLLICGHSHMLRIDRDKTHQQLLCVNPGAAGHHGFHLVRTIMIVRFADKQIANLKIIELGPRGVRDDVDPKTVDLGSYKIPDRN